MSDFALRTTCWSLLDGSSTVLPRLKHGGGRGLCFSADGRFCCLLERADGKDFICLVSCTDWHVSCRFQAATQDAEDVVWSPAGDALAAWDGTGIVLHALDGALLGRYADVGAAGCRACAWSPATEAGLLAAVGFDHTLTLLDATALNCVAGTHVCVRRAPALLVLT